MHRPARLLLAFTAAVWLGLAGCRKPAEPDLPLPVVSTLKLTPRTIPDEIAASGAIEAVDKSQVAFMVPGRVRSIAVDDGATVAAGQLLATLDDTDYRQEVAIAEARLAETRDRATRLRRMHELGSLTATDLEKINSALTQAESAATLARQHLAYTELRAPFAGIVTRNPVAVGTVVSAGLPLCSVLAPAPVWATLSVPEVEAALIRPGLSVQVRLAAMEQVVATAPVESILPQADAITRSFRVKVRLPNADFAFRPGNVVTARLALGTSHPVLLLPPTAVQHFPDGALFVWLVDPARQTVTRRIVNIGRTRETAVEVAAGLQGGEIVVTGFSAPLYDGMRVAPAAP